MKPGSRGAGPPGWRALLERAEGFGYRKRPGRESAGTASLAEHVEAREVREDERFRRRVERGK